MPARHQIVLHEARMVRLFFEAVVREHKSLRAVAHQLNTECVPASGVGRRSSTSRWRASTIHRVLRNPAYMGEAAFGKTERVERPPPLRLVVGRAATPKKPKKPKSGQARASVGRVDPHRGAGDRVG